MEIVKEIDMFSQQEATYYRQYAPKIQAALLRDAQAIVSHFKRTGRAELYQTYTKPVLRNLYMDIMGNASLNDFKRKDTIPEGLSEDEILLWLMENKEGQFQDSIDTFVSRLAKYLLSASAGLTIAELLGNYRGVINNYTQYLAENAIVEAMNSGNFLLAQKIADNSNIIVSLQWISVIDKATRANHRRLNGMFTSPGEPFLNGLRYPHDPQGEASEVVNCRCRLEVTIERI
ncbi:phage minor head protein [Fulvivirga sedimenti]|uniref:Phage head morphogenesis domain-containing protein n=1 Tax=Fulvivirga sedimenti TaxID=2879465 RepID=A0A9X1L1G6_9BACT|nr:phage minor head protein [Fulvivirga sedimenti]MCA6078814.1 hypothetical protein [Fulvivirga sedimenti]